MAFPSLSCQELLYHEIIKGSKGSPEEMRLAGMEKALGRNGQVYQHSKKLALDYVIMWDCKLVLWEDCECEHYAV